MHNVVTDACVDADCRCVQLPGKRSGLVEEATKLFAAPTFDGSTDAAGSRRVAATPGDFDLAKVSSVVSFLSSDSLQALLFNATDVLKMFEAPIVDGSTDNAGSRRVTATRGFDLALGVSLPGVGSFGAASFIPSLANTTETLATRDAHAIFLNEHATPKHLQQQTRAKLNETAALHDQPPWCLELAPLDPTCAKCQAGVGVMFRNEINAVPLQPFTTAFANIIHSGRGAIYAITLDTNTIMYVFNLYCFTGGHTRKPAPAPTR